MIKLKFIIIFKKNSKIYKFEILIKQANASFNKFFILRFMIINQKNRHDFYHKKYLIRNYEQTLTIILLEKYFYYNIFLTTRLIA